MADESSIEDERGFMLILSYEYHSEWKVGSLKWKVESVMMERKL